ncbi:MAG: histidine phosphatase family protein [Chitinispirillales bacterium]|jgi:broad specificity phosphatase PhoE|nr:histidine phosphatase family protein [Chitinispirillales bacterium]
MEIRLIRHGKPQFWENYEPFTVLSGDEVGIALADYKKSGILPDSNPPKRSVDAAKGVGVAYCSGLRRTVETASALGVQSQLIHNPMFVEPQVPYGFWKKTRLPLALWFVISKIGWFFGYSINCESAEKAKARAENAAAFLINSAKQYGTVLLVGHSSMNNMIFRALQKHKWKASSPFFDGNFWGCNILKPMRK